ncbi:MAG: hypothetical protein B6I36_03735 [Desulfobacteraceae bacterium 4572_35.1]|nr:MAG: hypothetical protein B6I36_03735 [Desulfobacteraceae bacterium 4572_35.1]
MDDIGGIVEQVLIAVTGVTAIWLSQEKLEKRRRYACIVGLIGQPLWFHTSWQAQQWGIFILAFFYTWAWIRGVRLYWLQRD